LIEVVERAETIGDEVQASEAESLEGREDVGFPRSKAMGNSNKSKRIVSLRLTRLDVSEMNAI
jgi:hypothetical protein